MVNRDALVATCLEGDPVVFLVKLSDFVYPALLAGGGRQDRHVPCAPPKAGVLATS